MKEKGVVISVKGDKAEVEILSGEACAKCAACPVPPPKRIAIAAGAEKLMPGDRVELDLAFPSTVKLYLVLYGAPFAAFAAGVFIAYALSASPVLSLAAGVLSAVGAYCLVGLYLKRYQSVYSDTVEIRKVDKSTRLC